MNQSGAVRFPIHVTNDLSRIARAERELSSSLKREPSVMELSTRTGLSGRYVKKLSMLTRKSCPWMQGSAGTMTTLRSSKSSRTARLRPMDIIVSNIRQKD